MSNKPSVILATLLPDLLAIAGACLAQTDIPFAGTKQDFYGFECYRLPGGGNIKPYYVVIPKQAAPGKPWIWSGTFWGDKMISPTEQVVHANLKLVEQGFHLVCSSPASVYGYHSRQTQEEAMRYLLPALALPRTS